MPSAAELALLYTDNLAAHGRDLSFSYKNGAAENPLTGAASAIGYTTGTIRCVCHDLQPDPSGKVRRIFGIRPADLATAGITLPVARGALILTDTASGNTEHWTCDSIAAAGDRGWIEVGATQGSGPRVAA